MSSSAIGPEGRPDFTAADQVRLTGIDKANNRLTVVRGKYGTFHCRSRLALPSPRMSTPARPSSDWAVRQDLFCNELCLISVLVPEESRAVEEAGQRGPGDNSYTRQRSTYQVL